GAVSGLVTRLTGMLLAPDSHTLRTGGCPGGPARACAGYGFAQSGRPAGRTQTTKRYRSAPQPGMAIAPATASLERAGTQSHAYTRFNRLGLELRSAHPAARPCLIYARWATDSLIPTGPGTRRRLALARSQWLGPAF